MAFFSPFPAIRYDQSRVDLGTVVSPPYDVIDADMRHQLAARSPYNAVRIDLPVEEEGRDRYEVARDLLHDWQAAHILRTEEQPSFTVYRMSYRDDAGRSRDTTGVIGALELTPPGNDILPHEHTTPKDRSDRLDMLRYCRANTSAIWGLSVANGLTGLLATAGPPVADLTDADGVRHRAWPVTDPEVCAAIAAAVGSQPVVVADGHHRYETSLAYRGEREVADGDAGPAAATLAYVVELVEDELTVRAIHRLLHGLPEGFDLPGALRPWFEPLGPPEEGVPVTVAMERAGALCLVLPDRELLLRPRPETLGEVRDLDTARLDVALGGVPEGGVPDSVEVAFQHGPDNVRAAVASGRASAGVLVRPAGVAQIEATAYGGERMPPKTTFFHPKPKTGLVFRSLD